ncbi:MAG TPA: ATP F0F1 synthase subunit B [Devosiaceae bacterium]|nr:ATP F0F1 synthase subunit B [Devosiaceae bacterium]
MAFDAAFFALISLIIFLGVLIYLKLPGRIVGMLDERTRKIAADLDEAKRLREEAQALLAEYERKRKSAEDEAAEIIEAAREDANRLTSEAAAALQDLVARRTRAVEEKIGQAESQAIAEVRARSADIAVEAARVVLAEQVKDKSEEFVAQAIRDISAKLN